jgi:hypothetical protein
MTALNRFLTFFRKPLSFSWIILYFIGGLIVFAVACNKSSSRGSTPAPPPPAKTDTIPGISSLSPATANAGDTIFIKGSNLGTDISKLKAELNDTLALTIYQANCMSRTQGLVRPAGAGISF